MMFIQGNSDRVDGRIVRGFKKAHPSRQVGVVSEEGMSKQGHRPPIPVANHSQKGTGDHSEILAAELRKKARINPAEQEPDREHQAKHNEQGLFQGPSRQMIGRRSRR